MSEACASSCSECGVDCDSRVDPKSLLAEANQMSRVDRVVGVVSGKGGVGKSLVTALLACASRRAGHETAILDADITGPSIPRLFGPDLMAVAGGQGMIPAQSRSGIRMMSINLLLDNETDPVVWRGPIIAGTVKQFWTDVFWGDVDTMFVDMPPGTGDVPLTVFQSLPLSGVVVVVSPQELVGMIVEKAVKMARKMNVPMIGVVENMSYFTCPDCGKQHRIFGESRVEELAARWRVSTVARIPIDPAIAAACDRGGIEEVEAPWLDELVGKCCAKCC